MSRTTKPNRVRDRVLRDRVSEVTRGGIATEWAGENWAGQAGERKVTSLVSEMLRRGFGTLI